MNFRDNPPRPYVRRMAYAVRGLHLNHAPSRHFSVIDGLKLQVSASLGEVFYPQQSEMVAKQLLRQADQAMQRNELELHYQPKVNMRTGELVGTEALLRRHHRTRGLLYPGSFLPVLQGNTAEPPDTDAHDCHFGIWLNSESTRQRYQTSQRLATIATLHGCIHGQANELIHWKQTHPYQQVQSGIFNVNRMRDELTGHLMNLLNEVATGTPPGH